MKLFLVKNIALFLIVVASTFAIVVAESIPGQGGYSGGGASPFSAGAGGFNFGNGGYTTGFGSGAGQASASMYSAPGDSAPGSGQALEGPQAFKYISIHAAPEDPDDQATKTVRVPGGNNKHVKIIFVKAPSNGADQKTEVVLPEPDEHKNLVWPIK